MTDRNWTAAYVKPSVRYRTAPFLMLHGGVGLFYNFLPGDDLPELRPFIGVRLLGPEFGGGFVVSNYLRVELRAFYIKSTASWDAGLRGRWQLQVTSPRFNIGSAEEFYALASVEPFFDLDGSIPAGFGDRFRVNIGLGKQLTPSLRGELNYMFHKVRVPDQGGVLEVDDHVVRLRFNWTVRQ